MRQFLILMLSFGLLSLPVVAQDFPKAEIFGGYQYTHFEGSVNANGWNASLTGNVNHWFGVAADFSGAYKAGDHVHTYMFGPVFSARSDKVTPFAHALFGGASGGGTNAFAMAFGGGVDVKVAEKVAFRLIQGDWLLFRSEGFTSKKNARISTGIVFRF
jgi:opacity protein-like surface antigen